MKTMKRLRTFLKWIWIYALFFSGAFLWARWRLRQRGAILVLTFHRVLRDADYAVTRSPRGMLIREATFEKLAGYVARSFTVVGLADHPSWDTKHSRLRIVITFDDGWVDNATVAYPILEKYGLPATIFACTNLIDQTVPSGAVRDLYQSFGFSDDSPRPAKTVLNSLPHGSGDTLQQFEQPAASSVDAMMTWQDIEWLAQRGIVFGSHTHSHQILTKVPTAEILRELSLSKEELERRLSRPCVLFAYPNGDYSPDVRAVIEQADFRFAFTTDEDTWTNANDPLLIPRINIWEGNVVGPMGWFSSIMAQYTVLWKPYSRQLIGTLMGSLGLIRFAVFFPLMSVGGWER